MLSHVVHESDNFVPNLTSQPEFNSYIDKVFTGQPAVANKIETVDLYKDDTYPNRIINVARDAFFTGNILQLYNAYQSTGKVYVAKYGWPSEDSSKHAYDLLPTFYYSEFKDIVPLLQKLANLTKPDAEKAKYALDFFSPRYKQYFVSHATKGDPNAHRIWLELSPWPFPHYNWKPAKYNQDTLVNVAYAQRKKKPSNCKVGCLDTVNDDDVLTRRRYDFWLDIAKTLTPSNSSSSEHMSEPEGPLGFEDELK